MTEAPTKQRIKKRKNRFHADFRTFSVFFLFSPWRKASARVIREDLQRPRQLNGNRFIQSLRSQTKHRVPGGSRRRNRRSIIDRRSRKNAESLRIRAESQNLCSERRKENRSQYIEEKDDGKWTAPLPHHPHRSPAQTPR